MPLKLSMKVKKKLIITKMLRQNLSFVKKRGREPIKAKKVQE